MHGLAAWKQFVGELRTAFPDVQFTIDDLLMEGDKGAVRYTMRGTQRGVLMSIAPTGKQVTVSAISTGRFADGKVAEIWDQTDDLGMLQQLGVVPPPGQAGV